MENYKYKIKKNEKIQITVYYFLPGENGFALNTNTIGNKEYKICNQIMKSIQAFSIRIFSEYAVPLSLEARPNKFCLNLKNNKITI
jgi:hypothetical protein